MKLRVRAYYEAAELLERAMDGSDIVSNHDPDLTEEEESLVREYIRDEISAQLRRWAK